MTGDLNEDGNQDLVIGGYGYFQSLSDTTLNIQTFVSNSDGGYAALPAQSLPLTFRTPNPSKTPNGINLPDPVLADINGDGRLD